jgi:hypothetical protein
MSVFTALALDPNGDADLPKGGAELGIRAICR